MSGGFSDGFIWSTATGLATKLGAPVGWSAFPMAASHDGTVIVGYLLDDMVVSHPARWDNAVLTTLPAIAGITQACACSADASVIIGNTAGGGAGGYWTGGGAVGHVLPPLGGDSSVTVGRDLFQGEMICSLDGSIIIGTSVGSSETAVYWTNGVPTALPNVDVGSQPHVASCSDDGSVITGWTATFRFLACYWKLGTQYQLAFDITGDSAFAYGIKTDGSIVFGDQPDATGIYWTDLSSETDGLFGIPHRIVTDSPYTQGVVTVFANTATILAGNVSNFSSGPFAARWATSQSVMEIRAGWTQSTSNGISGDGAILAGTAILEDGSSIAVMWNVSGTSTILQIPPGYNNTYVVGINRNGGTIFGAAYPLSGLPTWVISSSTVVEIDSGVGDVWIDNTYVDFSNASTRANFINPDGTWLYYGPLGDFPTGTSPINWLTIPLNGVPSDILTGFGQNGAQSHWSLLDVGNNPITAAPYAAMSFDVCLVVPTSKQALDNLLVTFSAPVITDDRVSLRWSDDGGASWSNRVTQTMGDIGEYYTDILWRRLGIARSRVYEISWSGANVTAITGVWVELDVLAT